jgi:hypothetical protein
VKVFQSFAQKKAVPSTGTMTLAEQLKLDKLFQTFPSFDRSCVKDMYDTNKYCTIILFFISIDVIIARLQSLIRSDEKDVATVFGS